MTNQRYQFPFIGGMVTGCGLGLWLFPALMRTDFFRSLGPIGSMGLGFVLVVLGVLLGLATRTRNQTPPS
jgi:hypothetical protein